MEPDNDVLGPTLKLGAGTRTQAQSRYAYMGIRLC